MLAFQSFSGKTGNVDNAVLSVLFCFLYYDRGSRALAKAGKVL
jgi:hypothetical protein